MTNKIQIVKAMVDALTLDKIKLSGYKDTKADWLEVVTDICNTLKKHQIANTELLAYPKATSKPNSFNGNYESLYSDTSKHFTRWFERLNGDLANSLDSSAVNYTLCLMGDIYIAQLIRFANNYMDVSNELVASGE